MGLESVGWKVKFANDFSEKKFQMYNDFFPGSSTHYRISNIFDLHYKEIPQTDLATCSFPCIDLSLAGNMNGIVNGNHSSAFWGFTKIIEEQGENSPRLLLIENVPGWLHSNKGNDFRVTVKSLNDLGYSCDVFTLDALRFTPQSRQRIFLLCSKKNPTPGYFFLVRQRPKSLLSDHLFQIISQNTDLNWFYNEIPNPPSLKTRTFNEIAEEFDDSNEIWWPTKLVDHHLEMMSAIHRIRIEELQRQNKITYRTFYRRSRNGKQMAEVRNDDFAGCLRTAVGGSGKQFVIKVGFGKIKMRTMTPREYARLQGVPDTYHFNSSGVDALTAFGDAVCVPAISWIGENVLNKLSGIISSQ